MKSTFEVESPRDMRRLGNLPKLSGDWNKSPIPSNQEIGHEEAL
jgi:hypothetical protein